MLVRLWTRRERRGDAGPGEPAFTTTCEPGLNEAGDHDGDDENDDRDERDPAHSTNRRRNVDVAAVRDSSYGLSSGSRMSASMMARQKAPRSAGWRDVIRLSSTTTS